MTSATQARKAELRARPRAEQHPEELLRLLLGLGATEHLVDPQALAQPGRDLFPPGETLSPDDRGQYMVCVLPPQPDLLLPVYNGSCCRQPAAKRLGDRGQQIGKKGALRLASRAAASLWPGPAVVDGFAPVCVVLLSGSPAVACATERMLLDLVDFAGNACAAPAPAVPPGCPPVPKDIHGRHAERVMRSLLSRLHTRDMREPAGVVGGAPSPHDRVFGAIAVRINALAEEVGKLAALLPRPRSTA